MTSGTSDGAMKELHESNGRHTTTLRVPAQWKARKYDDDQDASNPFFKNHIKKASGLSAVDFVAHDETANTLLLIECKDFRGDDGTLKNLPRLADTPSDDESTVAQYIKKNKLAVTVQRAKPYLPREFAKNVRDTLIGLTAAQRADDPALKGFIQLFHAGQKFVCVLSLEMDAVSHWQPGEAGRLLGRLKTAIEREISFLQNVELVICSGLHTSRPHSYEWEIVASS